MSKVSASFNGCSFTFGEGFDVNQRHLCYPTLASNLLDFDFENIAKGGSSNYLIFIRSLNAVLDNKHDIYFVQWTALNRVWFFPGPDTVFFTNDNTFPDYTYRDIYLSPSQKSKFQEYCLLLNHDYQNIFDLVDYCRTLTQLVTQQKKKIYFINGMLPWKNDLITPLGADLNQSLSEYSKSMLDFDNRSDEEIRKFFSALQNKVNQLDFSNWVNPWSSFADISIDSGPLGHHPGIKSHAAMANLIYKHIS